MAETEQGAGGLANSVRRIGGSLLGLMETRIELFALEFQEEKLRAFRLMAWFALAVALGAASVLVTVGALGLYLWQTAGYAGLIGLAIATLGAGGAILWSIHRRILHRASPFTETISEFRKDAACLRQPE